VLCNGFDGTKALSVGEAPEPHPAADEVLIDVYAASVSYMDYLMICGGYQMKPSLPYVPGTDAAGVVVACGEKVERFHPGDRVACENWFGGFAERMTAKASKTARLPDNTDFIVGSTLLHIYLTAWYALVDRARLQAGETVLVTGAQAASASLASSWHIYSEPGSSRPSGVRQRSQSCASTAPMKSSTTRAKRYATG
jgi:NADPH2:quinone reductase